MQSFTYWYRSRRARTSRSDNPVRRRGWRPEVEVLEDRCLLTLGTPAWLPQGPTAIANITAGGLAANGAVQAVAIDPTNANRMFAATVDGGVWSTTNATTATPTWTSLTDSQPFLGTSAIAFDPTDATNNTLWVGTGRFSNSFIQNGPTVGLYKTVTGGTNWTNVGQSTFQGLNISNVIPTALKDPTTQKQVILVSTQATAFAGGDPRASNIGPAGVYRSPDGGTTWTLISGGTQANGMPTGLPAGDVWQMVADPGNSQRFYAGVTLAGGTGGVYVTVNGGLSWSEVAGDATLKNSPLTNVSGIKLAVHNDPNNNVLYAAVVNTKGDLSAVLRSTNQGGAWTPMDLPGDPVKSVNPGDQGPGNDDIVADPVSPTVVFVAGDRSYLFRGDASNAVGSTPTQQWTSITNDGASGTVPHADSRAMTFDANGNLIETDDGGIYRLSTPNVAATRTWTFISSTMAVNAATFVAYDDVNHVVFGGAQDNGSPTQTTPGSTLASDTSSGDGTVAQADNVSQPGFSIHYTTAQNFFFIRTVYNGTNNPTTPVPLASAAFPTLTVTGAGKPLDQLGKPPFTTQFAVDAVGGNRLLIGTRFLYESLDGGTSLTALGGLTPDNKPKSDVGQVTTIAYGGRLNGVDNPDVAYVGTDGSGTTLQGLLLLRSAAGAAFAVVANYPGSTPTRIVLDPDNWKTGYIVDSNNRVWRMTNAGASAGDFVDITGNLATLGLTLLRTIAVYPNTNAPNDEVVFVGGYSGQVAATDNATLGANTKWTAFGNGLPNVMVTGLVYDAADNVLAASTYGRGFWEVQNLSSVAGHAAPTVKLNAPAGTGNNFTTTFTAGGAAVAITDPGASITAPASTTLSQVTITLANPIDGTSEVLTANTTGTNITAVAYNPASGQLILRGTDTVANYQKVLATVTYNDTATTPSNNPRFINVLVNDGAATGRATTTVQITGGVQAPAVTGSDTGTNGAAPMARANVPVGIGSNLKVQAGASATLASATVTIANPLDAPNELLGVTTTGTAITASYNAQTATLTLTGTDTVANYQQVLDTLTYENLVAVPSLETREIRVQLNDGTRQSLANALFVDIEDTNYAPVLVPGAVFTLSPIRQGQMTNPGTFVADLLNSAVPGNAITDLNPNGQVGIAIVGADNAHGQWQYTVDGGNTWQDLVFVSPTRAVLMTDDADSLVRFVPQAGFSGTVADGLTFRAWDMSGAQPGVAVPDSDGSFADTTQNGGTTPFSSSTAQASITVTPINQPPSFQLSPSLTVLATAGPQTIPNFATNIQPGGLGGTGAKVTFQVTNNNNSFFSVQPALSPNGTLTFTPAIATSGGTATVTVVAQNDAGTANGGQNTSAPQTFTITVTPVTPTVQFLAQLYQDVLQRPIDAGGQTFFGNQLAGGASRMQVALELVQSPEGRTDEVQQLYQHLLGRSGDTAGLAGWVQALNAGTSLSQIEAAFLGSPEYGQKHGGTNAGFLAAVYQDVLGRAIDSGGQTGWMNQLAAGASRSSVALAILQSMEGLTDVVNALYSSLLHRSADSVGLASDLAALQQGVSREFIEAAILGSPEYLSTHTTP